MRIIYGYSVEPFNADPFIDLIEAMLANISHALTPMAWMVDIVPFLKHLPDGLPGMKFKRKARLWNRLTQTFAQVPFAFVRRQMARDSQRPSYVSRLLQENQSSVTKGELSHDNEEAIKWSALVQYGGSVDTTASALTSFILAMVLFPDVQKKAQAEMDRVIGHCHLPQFGDRDRLPLVEGIVNEALRWLPVAPMGVAHAADEDITYGGYLIPKGVILAPATWWFAHDPATYKDPDFFDPERYLAPRREPDPRAVVFGFGRRCPGLYLADSALFLTIAQILATFHVGKAVDQQGAEVEPELRPTPGVVSRPAPFPLSIVPKSTRHADIVWRLEVEQPWEKSDAGLLEGDFMVLLQSKYSMVSQVGDGARDQI